MLADWNGLMIAALARAALASARPDWLAAAEAPSPSSGRCTAAGRLRHAGGTAAEASGRWTTMPTWPEAALALHEATGPTAYLIQAAAWIDGARRALLGRRPPAATFFTADDTADLIVRTKNAYDNAVPSGNGRWPSVLAKLFHLTGNDHLRDRAEALMAAFAGELEPQLLSAGQLLNGVELLSSSLQIVIVGERGRCKRCAAVRAACPTACRSRPRRGCPAGNRFSAPATAGRRPTSAAGRPVRCRSLGRSPAAPWAKAEMLTRRAPQLDTPSAATSSRPRTASPDHLGAERGATDDDRAAGDAAAARRLLRRRRATSSICRWRPAGGLPACVWEGPLRIPYGETAPTAIWPRATGGEARPGSPAAPARSRSSFLCHRSVGADRLLGELLRRPAPGDQAPGC